MPGPVLGTASLAGAAHSGGTHDGSQRAGALTQEQSGANV